MTQQVREVADSSTPKAGECFLPAHPIHAHPAPPLTCEAAQVPWQDVRLKS